MFRCLSFILQKELFLRTVKKPVRQHGLKTSFRDLLTNIL